MSASTPTPEAGQDERVKPADNWAALAAMAQYDLGRGATPYPHCNHRRQREVKPGLTQCVVCALLTVAPLLPVRAS